MDYQIDTSLSLVMCKPKNNFTFMQLYEHLITLLNDPNFCPGMPGLYDFSDVDKVSGDITHFLKTSDTVSDHQVIDKPAPVAIVLDRSNTSMKRVFEGYILMASNSQVAYKIFYTNDYNSALEYVGLKQLPSFYYS